MRRIIQGTLLHSPAEEARGARERSFFCATDFGSAAVLSLQAQPRPANFIFIQTDAAVTEISTTAVQSKQKRGRHQQNIPKNNPQFCILSSGLPALCKLGLFLNPIFSVLNKPCLKQRERNPSNPPFLPPKSSRFLLVCAGH